MTEAGRGQSLEPPFLFLQGLMSLCMFTSSRKPKPSPDSLIQSHQFPWLSVATDKYGRLVRIATCFLFDLEKKGR